MKTQVRLPDRRLRIAFFGTPELARTVLERGLFAPGEHDVVLVVCQPDRPAGRGRAVAPPPVKQAALARGIEVAQPTKMKDGFVRGRLLELQVDLGIVAAFGRILPPDVLEAAPLGHFNVHASLLPRHRGASPIQFSIWAGDEVTGVTLMQMTPGLDEGPMLLVAKTPIAPGDTSATLGERLAGLGADLVREGLALGRRGELFAEPQDDGQATFARLLDKADGRLDFGQPAARLERQIRAFDPWPGTFVELADGPLKVLGAEVVPGEAAAPPGTVVDLTAGVEVATASGRLRLTAVQPAGKRPMSAADFLRGAGRALAIGQRLGAPSVS